MRVRTVAVRSGDDCETGPAPEGELGSAHLPTQPSLGERKQPPKTAISIAMLAAAISLGIALALVVHVFG